MNDRALFTLIMTHLGAAMAANANLAGVGLSRNYQAKQAGASSSAWVYFAKIMPDKRHGFVGRKDTYNDTSGTFDHVETQVYETSIQFMALVPQVNPSATDLTGSDILNMVSGIMQSDSMREAFRASGVGMLRVTEVRNPPFTDDRDQYEMSPAFDIVFTHTRETAATVAPVTTYDARINRV